MQATIEATEVRAGGRRRSAARSTLGRALLPILPLIALVLLWQLATTVWLTQERLFPPPAKVGEELVNILRGEGPINSTYVDAAATLGRTVTAWVLAFVLGAPLGVLAGRKAGVFQFVSTPLWVSMAVPSVVWAFIFVVMLGTGNIVPIAALMALLLPNVVIPVAEGTKALSRELAEMATSYGTSTAQKVRHVYLPQLTPYLFSSARVSFSLALKVAVVAEVIGLEKGIGYELDYWYTQTVLAPIVAWGFVLVAIGLIVDHLVFSPLERRVNRWRPSPSGSTRAREVV